MPRTALILEQYKGLLALDWRTHPAHWPPEYDLTQKIQKEFHDATLCLRLRWHGFPKSKFVPGA